MPPERSVCNFSTFTCESVPQSGPNECLENYDCQSHLECENQACVRKDGHAPNTCAFDDECVTHGECILDEKEEKFVYRPLAMVLKNVPKMLTVYAMSTDVPVLVNVSQLPCSSLGEETLVTRIRQMNAQATQSAVE